MDEFRAGPAGFDGTQAPPPPPVFADPLAGLVTGEQLPRRKAPPVLAPPPTSVPAVHAGPAAAAVPRVGRPPVRQARGQARRQPEHVPAPEAPKMQPAPTMRSIRQTQAGLKKNRGGLIGCLVALAALSGLLLNVVREIVEAVVELVR